MPHFFFNIHQGSRVEPDEEGLDLPSLERAISEAKTFLPALAQDISWEEACDVAVVVVDETGEVVFTASLRLTSMQPNERRRRSAAGIPATALGYV